VRDFVESNLQSDSDFEIYILRNGGASFDGKLMPTKLFKEHAIYPSEVHHLLSHNDQRHHGAAKAVWYKMKLDGLDDVESTLALMHELDIDQAKNSALYFARNILRGTKKEAMAMHAAGQHADRARIDIYEKYCQKKGIPLN
jgi:hypothetical protein